MTRKNYSSFNRVITHNFKKEKKTMFEVFMEELERTYAEMEVLMDYPCNINAGKVLNEKKKYCEEMLDEIKELIREI